MTAFTVKFVGRNGTLIQWEDFDAGSETDLHRMVRQHIADHADDALEVEHIETAEPAEDDDIGNYDLRGPVTFNRGTRSQRTV